MADNKRRDLKRAMAQAVNHLAAAILDVNNVYEAFQDGGKPEAENLKTLMIGLNAIRDALLRFVKWAWELDEENLSSYM